MNKLEVGMYIRTNNGIGKITRILCGEDLYFDGNVYDEYEKETFMYNPPSTGSSWTRDNILKASYNIIDLIEVGDYVNGYRVVERIDNWLDLGTTTAENKDIKSILTKEQFESMEYKVGDSNE